MPILFEDQPAEKQKMTFKTYRSFARKYWGESALPEGVYARSKIYNNFALMLSDQCPWHIRVRAGGNEHVYVGPLVIQLRECLWDIKETTPFVNITTKVARYKRFPGTAIQEALVNAIIHFDPSKGHDIVVDYSDDLMTITSPGGFIEQTGPDRLGYTSPRNVKTSMLLESLGYARMIGRGMGLIRSCYCTSGLIPMIISSSDDFIIQLPSLDSSMRTSVEGSDVVLEYLRMNRSGNILSLSKQMMMSTNKMKSIFDELESDGRILTMGLGGKRTAFYIRSIPELDDIMLPYELAQIELPAE